MKTKQSNTKGKQNINVITLGCPKNLVDSEVLMGKLQLSGNFAVTHQREKPKKDDIVIINTCGFINKAKQESVNTILEYTKLKNEGKIKKLIVTGCLSQRYKTQLEEEISEVDAYFGSSEESSILKNLGLDYKHELIGERILTTPLHYAYLKISEGCNRKCSFCSIPLIRGKHVSKEIPHILKEAKNLVKKGVKELILIAQDLTYYGIDIYKRNKLAYLIDCLSEIQGIEWIRLQYAYPARFPMEIIDIINNRTNICNYLDIPIQHISDPILKSMARGINKKQTLDLINMIRDKAPDIALRTTVISGYPGETQAHHEELMDFLEQTRFDRLGVFTYSHEENTPAYKLEDNVLEDIKEERMARIMDLQQSISLNINNKKIGHKIKVIIDRQEEGYFIGRTEFDSPEVDNEVLIEVKDQKLETGEFYDAMIYDAQEFDLYGSIS